MDRFHARRPTVFPGQSSPSHSGGFFPPHSSLSSARAQAAFFSARARSTELDLLVASHCFDTASQRALPSF